MINYLRAIPILVALVFVGVSVYLDYNVRSLTRDNAAKDAEIAHMKATNDSLALVLDTVNKLAAKSDAITANTAAAIDDIRIGVLNTREQLSEIKAGNDEIKNYMVNSIPDDIKRLLNNRDTPGKN